MRLKADGSVDKMSRQHIGSNKSLGKYCGDDSPPARCLHAALRDLAEQASWTLEEMEARLPREAYGAANSAESTAPCVAGTHETSTGAAKVVEC
ncbi:hypothetical protein HaLaN_11971 [Haematococcus lacustris]|uniref:Uncharacterized protein n=1 Tax=Haematococcus lacustris TaxID=44745 RepID=A0A699Z912_HAELA|nr:hypothetical protein HaLaN_11971 [Haematococcus lacustris]